jgi:hypothetical protein
MLEVPEIKPMKLLDIIKYSNVSSVLLLPIFNKLFSNQVTFKYYNNHVYPFSQICFDNGLIKAYSSVDAELLNKASYQALNVDPDTVLYLLFNITQLQNEFINKNLSKVKIESKYVALSDMIISSKYFLEIFNIELMPEYVLIAMQIPSIYKDDVLKIKQSKYSQVSKDYKNSVDVNFLLPNNRNNLFCFYINSFLGYNLISKNFAIMVLKNDISLKKRLAKELNIDIDTIEESYELFNFDKEHFDSKKLLLEKDLYNLKNLL